MKGGGEQIDPPDKKLSLKIPQFRIKNEKSFQDEIKVFFIIQQKFSQTWE